MKCVFCVQFFNSAEIFITALASRNGVIAAGNTMDCRDAWRKVAERLPSYHPLKDLVVPSLPRFFRQRKCLASWTFAPFALDTGDCFESLRT